MLPNRLINFRTSENGTAFRDGYAGVVRAASRCSLLHKPMRCQRSYNLTALLFPASAWIHRRLILSNLRFDRRYPTYHSQCQKPASLFDRIFGIAYESFDQNLLSFIRDIFCITVRNFGQQTDATNLWPGSFPVAILCYLTAKRGQCEIYFISVACSCVSI